MSEFVQEELVALEIRKRFYPAGSSARVKALHRHPAEIDEEFPGVADNLERPAGRKLHVILMQMHGHASAVHQDAGDILDVYFQVAQVPADAEERRERAERQNLLSTRPDGAAIARMDMALEWLRDLRAIDSGLALVTSFWALRAARHRSVRALCREKGWVPATFYKLRGRALARLADELNRRGVAVF